MRVRPSRMALLLKSNPLSNTLSGLIMHHCHSIFLVCVGVLGCLAVGCKTVRPLDVDNGRVAFLQGQFDLSQTMLTQAEMAQRTKDQSSYSKLFGDLMTKTFARGGYQAMFRDRFLTHFYLALDYLGMGMPKKALTEMRKMLRLMDKLSIDCEAAPGRDGLAEVSEELNQEGLQDKLRKYHDSTLSYWDFADQEADWQKARFYNSAALLLAAFLEGCQNGASDEFQYACRLIEESQLGRRTVLELLNGVNGGLSNWVLVIAAVGKGPVLVERKIGVTGAQLISFTALPKEHDSLVQQNGLNFDPERPLLLEAGGQTTATEIAARLFTSLAADFALRENRLYWEQIIRVVVRDLLVEGGILGGSEWIDDAKTALWVKILGSITWFFVRQALMAPDLRCLQRAPWDYQVALLKLPADRQMTCRLATESVQVTFPDDFRNAVLYLDCYGYGKTALTPILLKVK